MCLYVYIDLSTIERAMERTFAVMRVISHRADLLLLLKRSFLFIRGSCRLIPSFCVPSRKACKDIKSARTLAQAAAIDQSTKYLAKQSINQREVSFK